MRPEEREAYRLHARLPAHRRAVDGAKEIVRRALAEHPGTWAVAASGGKDSTAMLDLCLDAGWRGPLFHFWYAETPAENTALVLALAERHGLPVDTVRVPGAWDVYEAVGHFFPVARTAEERAATRAMLRGYKDTADGAARERGYTGLFIGLRAEESRPRAITISRKGVIYRTEDRCTVTCLPLARWTARDVWARHLTRGLPWLPRYDAAEDRERERSEVTWLAAEGLWRHGQASRIRETDPALWARLTERWPEIGALA